MGNWKELKLKERYLKGPVASMRFITVAEAARGLIGIRGAFFGISTSIGIPEMTLSVSSTVCTDSVNGLNLSPVLFNAFIPEV